MTFTYEDPAKSNLEAVRFEIGDTTEKTHLVNDEEITYALTKASNNVLRAAARICYSLAARFTRQENVRVSTYSKEKGNVAAKYIALARLLVARANAASSIGGFLVPSISKADKLVNEENTDATEPFFKRKMHDNPNVSQTTDSKSEVS